jgi:hypothetical protein
MKHTPEDLERRGLRVLEVARTLGCSATTVHSGIMLSTIPRINFGAKYLVSRAWVDQQLGRGPTGPSDETMLSIESIEPHVPEQS